jgi:hypothetical protein
VQVQCCAGASALNSDDRSRIQAAHTFAGTHNTSHHAILTVYVHIQRIAAVQYIRHLTRTDYQCCIMPLPHCSKHVILQTCTCRFLYTCAVSASCTAREASMVGEAYTLFRATTHIERCVWWWHLMQSHVHILLIIPHCGVLLFVSWCCFGCWWLTVTILFLLSWHYFKCINERFRQSNAVKTLNCKRLRIQH